MKNRLKHDLCEDLQRLGFNTRGKTIKEVQELATSQNLPITVEENDIIKGWVGKPKGMRQVLWERGLLDPHVTYVAKIKKDDPNLEEKVEYAAVLADCADFLGEKTSLMYLGERLGVEVDRSTKCHPELAGEGIEYSWGRAKSVYRRAKLADKKGKENFRRLVADCLSSEQVAGKGALTPEMIRKFSRRARQYILAYFFIEHKMNIEEEGLHEINIEGIKKEFKTHRSAIDFDEKFINYCFHKSEAVSSSEQSAAATRQ